MNQVDDNRLNKLEMIRAAVLVMLGVGLVAVDLGIAYELPDNRSQVYELLLLLQAELALVLAVVVFWPGRRWLRLILGSFAAALVWLAVVKLAAENFLFQATVLSKLLVGLLMMCSFSLPCGIYFLLQQRFFGQRLTLLGRQSSGNPRAQFGLRQLLLLTACFALVAFAARAHVPDRLAGQFVLQVNYDYYMTLSLLCLFPGLAAGPLSATVLRPSWWALWTVPWLCIVGLGEMVFVELAVANSNGNANITAEAVGQVALLVASNYAEVAMFLAGVFGLARLGGLRLEPQSDL